MKQTISYRTLNLIRWVCICGVIFSQLGLFPLNVAAQEPVTEPPPLPTPTPAPTWTPTPAPTNTANPTATPTVPSGNSPATPSGRLVDFRVDDDEISKGECVMFSWVTRGDIDRVEFDQRDDDKAPILVSTMDTRQECPDEETDYDLIVTWLVDGTQTTHSIQIEVDSGSGGDGSNSAGGGTTTPAGTAVFVAVTPILITVTPVSAGGGDAQQAVYQDTSGGAVVKPGGELASVQLLPETGYLSSPAADTNPSEDNLAAAQPRWRLWLALAGGLSLFLGVAVLGLTLVAKTVRESEASR